jgi:hypothetical protein
MPDSLDIHLLPLVREAGKDLAELPGLYLAEPPRRTARGRDQDRLLLYLSLTGNAPLSPGKLQQILERLAQTYYKQSGSVTSALRTVADTLNQFLLDRNVRNASTGRQATGWLTLVTLRGTQMYMAQSGPVHAFVVNAQEVQHLYDPQLTGRGLGLSRTTPIRYFQANLQPGDAMLLAVNPVPAWNAGTLSGAYGQGLESLRRRLVSRNDLELNAVLVQFRPGAGKVRWSSVRSTPSSDIAPTAGALAASQPARDLSVPVSPVETHPDLTMEQQEAGVPGEISRAHIQQAHAEPAVPEAAEQAAPASDADQPTETILAESGEPPVTTQESTPSVTEEFGMRPSIQERPEIQIPAPGLPQSPVSAPRSRPPGRVRSARPRLNTAGLVRVLVVIGRPFSNALDWLMASLKSVLRRLLPDEAIFSIPTRTMAFIAVAVPIMVVAVASFVYVSKGVAIQSQELLAQAQDSYQKANAQQDPLARRERLLISMNYLQQAESYQVTAESQNLRTQLESGLDELDLVKRPNYQSAIFGGLPGNTRVVRVVLADGDLYLLDGTSGNVLRAQVTPNRDYQLDTNFQCGPGLVTGQTVSPLIDIAAAPAGNDKNAVIIGIDATGSVIYCIDGLPPIAESLARPLTAPNWSSLQYLAVDPDQANIFVLDKPDKAVWAYWNSNFTATPDLYFGDEVPQVQDVVSMAVDKRDLYLLHADSHVTLCSYSSLDVSPTRCADPVRYVDSRPGRSGQALLPEKPFTQVIVTQPPDPSLFMLQPETRTIYQFSLRTLNYHRQYVPAGPLQSGSATAFAVNPLERTLYLAIGSVVYQASIP